MATSVRRDPFARGEYRRECVGQGTCAWCGQKKKRVYTYVWENDSLYPARRSYQQHTFCDLECFDAYYY